MDGSCAERHHEANEALVGRRLKVYWPLEEEYYSGSIESYDPSDRKHVVLYDDGEWHRLNIWQETFAWLDDGPKAAAANDSSSAVLKPAQHQWLDDGPKTSTNASSSAVPKQAQSHQGA